MIVIPFKAHHIHEMTTYGGQSWVAEYIGKTGLDATDYEKAGPAFSGAVDGEIIGCAGLIVCHENRALTWAVFSDRAPRHFVSIHKVALAFLNTQAIRRIEAYVDTEFPAARRWVERLGFTCECEHMRDFFPGGRAGALWTRLK